MDLVKIVYLCLFIYPTHSEFPNTTVYDTKCCDFDSAFVKENNTYVCNKSEHLRVFVEAEHIFDFNTKWGQCVESVNSDLYLFKVKNSEPLIVNDINEMIVPKCCPNGFSYVPGLYSCKQDSNNTLFNSKFIRVGLPYCDIIYDYEFVSIHEFKIYKNYVYFPKFGEEVPNGDYCIDKTVLNTYMVRVCKTYEFCKEVQCIHKCCPDGQSFVNGSHCTDTFEYGLDVNRLAKVDGNFTDNFGIIHGYETGVYIPRERRFLLDEQGNFYSFEEKIGKSVYSVDEETYCIEHATKNGIIYGHTLFRIIPQIITELEKKFLFNRWAMVISCLFLILTIMYYIISRERSKVFGKILVSFCVALLVLFILLILNTFIRDMNRGKAKTLCKTIGFLLIYLSFSCFVWLQIMCYDIYRTFGSTKRFSTKHEKRKRDFKRFIYYSLYGWGLPLTMTLIPLTFHFVDVLPASIKVKVAEKKCLIERGGENYAEILFYISPLAIIQLVNLIFFVKTVRYCLRVKGDIQKMTQSTDLQKKQSKFRAQKERLGLIIKLSVTMGIFFLFEVVSSFYDFKQNTITEHIEIVWDFINCLQGLFIFLIFICKVKNCKKCQKKVSVDKLRKISLTTVSTKVTGVSSSKKSDQEGRRKCSKEEDRNKIAED